MWTYRISFLLSCLLLGIIPLLAQNQPKPPKVKKQKIQKIKIPFYFDGIRVGTDVSKLIFMGFNGDKSRFDLSTDISFSNRVHLNLTLGRSAMRSVIRRNSDSVVYSAQYINTGNFARLGVEYNLLRRVMNENGVYAGLHVGYASYRHSLDHAIRNSFWSGRNDVIISSFKEDGMSCVWGELSGALKGRIWRNFFAGYTIRLQYLLQVEDGKLVKSTDLPGFGSTQNNFNLLMSYQVWYRLPLGKNY